MTHLVLAVTEWLNFSMFTEYFKQLVHSVKREREIRRTINELNQLSDLELRDIGISRGMIPSIAMEAYYDNRDISTNKNLRGWV